MKLWNIVVLMAVLLISTSLQAQDSLARYSIEQLDSIYKTKKNPQEQLQYAAAMLEKGTKELNTQDTAYAKLLCKLGATYMNCYDFSNATNYLQQAIAIQKIKIPRHLDYAKTLFFLGSGHAGRGNYGIAESLYKEVLSIREELLGGQHPDYAGMVINLANLYSDMGNYPLAEQFYLRAKSIFENQNLTQHPFYLNGIGSLANLYSSTGVYALAEPLFKQSVKIAKENLGEKNPRYAIFLNNLAVFYMRRGYYNLAEPLFKQAQEIVKEASGDRNLDYALCLNNLAILYSYMGNNNLIEYLYKEALEIRREILGNKHPLYANTLINWASSYFEMGKYEQGEPLQKEAQSIIKEVLGDKHMEYAISSTNLASFYMNMRDFVSAEPLYIQALEIHKEILGDKHPGYATCLTNLTNLYKNIGRYELIEPLLKEALNIRKEVMGDKHPDYFHSLNSLGIFYGIIGAYDTVQYYFAQELPLRLDYLEEQGGHLGEKAKEDIFKTIVPYINRINSFAALHRQHDSLLVEVQNGLLLTKGYALAGVSELLPLIKNLNDSTLNATYVAWTYTKNQLGKAYEKGITQKGINVDSLQRLASEQEAILMRGSVVLKERLGYNKKRFFYKDLVSNVGKNEVAIDFVRFENEKKDTAWYYALVTQQNWQFPKFIPLCLESQLAPYASAEVHPEKESYITKSEWNVDLYDLIIKPLESYLKKKKTIHWSPVGLMNQVALGTLKNSKNKMLAERFEVHQYGALKDFIFKRQNEGSTSSIDKNVLLVGDIAFDLDESEHINLVENTKDIDLYASRSVSLDSTRGSSRFVALKGTKLELENLNKAFSDKKWTIQQLQQKDALEERVREFSGDKTPLVLHFATHGFFIPAPKVGHDNPLLRSGIALAGANRVWMGKPSLEGVEDGLWTAYEIANANLMQANLVVLSACETAKGQIDPHEGVVGLQRSFKIAGVENMLLSLWQVPDKETVELMEEFYKHYLNGATPSVALKKAQGVMRKKYPEPYYWAAFVLIE